MDQFVHDSVVCKTVCAGKLVEATIVQMANLLDMESNLNFR